MNMAKYNLEKNNCRYEGMSNLKMEKDVYSQRRKVIDLIYDAKKIEPNIPRVNVRITDNPFKDDAKCIRGVAGMGKENIIWIPKETLKYNKNDLRFVVYHELLHTAYGKQHKQKGIMTPFVQKGKTEKELNKMFSDELNEK